MNGQVFPELAPCGVWCGACPSYQKTCLGCASEDHKQGRRSKWGCKVRVCCYEKENVDYCMDCQKFPCTIHNQKLLGTHSGDPKFLYRHEIPENFHALKILGTKAYIEYQRKRFTCPDCGGLVYWYHYICSNCGNEVTVE
jgi:hypothetical protein